MSAFARLWVRAPAWRGVLLLSVALSGLAILYPPPVSLQRWSQFRSALPGARYTAAPAPAIPSPPTATIPSPPVAAPDIPVPDPAVPARQTDPSLPGFGTHVTGTVPFAGVTVPLPRGEWTVIAAISGHTSQGQKAATSILAQVTNGSLATVIILEAVEPLSTIHTGFPTDVTCQASSLLFGRVFSAVDHGPQACWEVDALVAQDWNMEGMMPILRSAIAELRQRGTALPTVVLRAHFFHADAVHLLTMQVLEAAPAPPQPPFGWTMAEVRSTPDKLARAVRLRNWAETWDALVRRSFEGRLIPADVTPALEELPR
jgi:hypothetical protein